MADHPENARRDLDWLRRLPKAELHVHIEGAVPHDTLWELIGKYGGDPSVPTREALEERFVYRDFPHFIETWIWKNGFLREYEDFTLIARAVARGFAEQNIRYVEAFYSPGDFARHGLETGLLTMAVREGLAGVSGVRVALVADLIRDFGPDNAAATLARVADVREEGGVIGIGIGGSEHEHPPGPFAPVYEKARDLGFRTSAHAGEAAGAVSVWAAARELKVDRIGHGTRAAEDEDLVEFLAETGLPLELCPLSNVRTGVVDSLEAHPVRRYFDRGLRVSVNTDDPEMFGNTLVDEYHGLMTAHGFTRREIRRLVLSSIDCSWLPGEEKDRMKGRFRADPAWE